MKSSIMIGITLILITCSTTSATGQLEFETKGKIEIIKIWLYPNELYAVDIQLKDAYVRDFSSLTGANVGKRLQVLFSGKVILSTVIHAQNNAGLIRIGQWESPSQALKAVEGLLREPITQSKLESVGQSGLCTRRLESLGKQWS
jgi:preprotein translocase subunit SecD